MSHKLIALILSLLTATYANVAMGQTVENQTLKSRIVNIWDNVSLKCTKLGIANKLDVGLSISSLGLGIEAQTPVTKWTNLRMGVDWFPPIKVPMSFDLSTYSDGIPTENFQHVQEMVYEMTGIEMHEQVKMNGKVSMVNFKFMVDVIPFQNDRRWHFTAGFFAGTSMVGKAINDNDEKTTLVGLNMYNRGYEYFTNIQNIYDVPLGGGNYMNPDVVEEIQDKFRRYGMLGIHFGDFKDGKPYMLYPAPDGTVSAKAYINHFKPYIGAGFTTPLSKDGRWNFSIDLGVVFWGGAPNIINHDWNTGRDISLTHDLVNIRGKVGDYVKIVKALPVCPLLALRFSYSIF